MSPLKQQFKRMLDIFIANDDDSEILEDQEVEFCGNKKPNDQTCIEDCTKCKYNYKEIVDLNFYNAYDDHHFYYSFRATKNRKITPITSYKSIYKELSYLHNFVIGESKRKDLEYHEKIIRLRKYADEFIKELSEKSLTKCLPNILPIRFHEFMKNWDECKQDTFTSGQYCRIGNQNIIDIYACRLLDEETLKRNIRHETIHYALDMCGLKNSDESGVFHALCKIYDAGAYKPMNEEEQRIRDEFLSVHEIHEFQH